MPAKPRKRPSGAAQLRASDKTGILIGWPNDQLDQLDEACRAIGRTRANFAVYYMTQAIQAILTKRHRKEVKP